MLYRFGLLACSSALLFGCAVPLAPRPSGGSGITNGAGGVSATSGSDSRSSSGAGKEAAGGGAPMAGPGGGGGAGGMGTTPSSTASSGGGATPGARGSGWQLRDAEPYARATGVSVLDSANDRLIVFGGGSNDTWALALSGPHQGEWTQIAAAGPDPPVHPYSWDFATSDTDAAVYDPVGKRVILLENPGPFTDTTAPQSVWQLSLSGEPIWSEIITTGPSRGMELEGARVVYDPKGNRLLAFGGTQCVAGVWALSLDAKPTWSRLGDAPSDVQLPCYAFGLSLVLDSEADQLVLFGGTPQEPRLFGFSLTTHQWIVLDAGSPDAFEVYANESQIATTVFDAGARRIVVIGGSSLYGQTILTYSLVTKTWTSASISVALSASGVLDPSRGRLLLSSGFDEALSSTTNAVVAVSLDTLTPSTLYAATRHAEDLGLRQVVFDPIRSAVIAFGGYGSGLTESHGLGADDAWAPLSAGTAPPVSESAAIYDPVAQAIVMFGGDDYSEQETVWRLSSKPGAAWETIAAEGPSERSRHVGVYDSLRHRMVIYGGERSSTASTTLLSDVWALSLDGVPAWQELTPKTGGPGAWTRAAAVYDPVGDRMIVIGSQSAYVWALSLGDTPAWQTLDVPNPMFQGLPFAVETTLSAVYDPTGHRMILVDQTVNGLLVHALELGEHPSLHRFCPGPESLTPGVTNLSYGDGSAVLAPDGLFVSVSGGALRFDLATAYCD